MGDLNGGILLAAPENLMEFEIWPAGTAAGSGRPGRYDFAQDCGWEWRLERYACAYVHRYVCAYVSA